MSAHSPGTDLTAGLTAPELRRAALWMLALAATIALVSFEQGQLTDGAPLFHELFHDARHLLGFPCH